EGGPPGVAWPAARPPPLAALRQEWPLSGDGEPMTRHCPLVLPARGESGRAALKLGWPHPESADEHLALRVWDGRSAVRLLRADPRRSGLLLERLTTEDLGEMWDEEAVAVVARLYRDLHVAPLPQVPALVPWVRDRKSTSL